MTPHGVLTKKFWGLTVLIQDHPMMSAHRIWVQEGGYCSWHLHEAKWNAFLVIEGHLIIENALGDVVDLHPGDYHAEGPGSRHRFRAVTEVLAFEWYWPEVLREDIHRFSEGGILP